MKYYLACVLLSISFIAIADNSRTLESDSARIVKLFNQALADTDQSSSFNEEAYEIVKSDKLNYKTLKDIYLYNYSKFLFNTSQLEKADSIAKVGLTLYSDAHFHYKTSKFYNIIATVLMFQNKHKLAITEFQKSITILELNNDEYQAALVKNNIANMFFSLIDYESSYKYSSQTYTTLKASNDTVYLPSTTGVFAISAIKLAKYQEGEKLAIECLDLSERYNDVVGLIVGNYSLGELYLAQSKFAKSSIHFEKSLEISKSIGHPHYKMLNKIGLLNLYVKAENYPAALIYGKEALEESNQMNNENTLYNIHKNLGYTYYGLKDYENAFINLDSAHNMFTAFIKLENKKAISDILLKYDTEKKEKEIIQNKLIITEGEIDLNKKKIWIFILVFLVLSLIVAYYFYSRFQKQKFILLKKEEEQNTVLALIEGEENERERISNELHDGVASSLTGIKIKLEHLISLNPNSDLESLVKQLAVLHEETRRISHNLMPISLNETSFLESLENYCRENSTANLKVIFSNLIVDDIVLEESKAIVLFRICQELINNTKKHADSLNCFIQVSLHAGSLTLTVEDEGVGFDTSEINNSQGLRSVRRRINTLGGEFTINSKISQGTLVIISIPV